MAHKDVLGREIKENDLVVMRTPDYSGVTIGKVESLTPKKVRVSYPSPHNKNERETKSYDSDYLYKMHDEDAIMYRLTRPNG